MQTVVIAGVGLIGGSFALALRQAGFEGRIWGVSSPHTIREALRLGVIDEGLPLDQAVPQADLVYLAQPIGRILDTLHHLDPLVKPEALVTDAGSTKGQIVATAHRHLRRCAFLGGHPMAGKESRGVAAADGALFRDRTYVLTPAAQQDLESAQAREFWRWIERIGARPVVIGPDEHDRVVSLTSHLPQLASTALAAVVAEGIEFDEQLAISGPGLIDSTRLALSAYELWRDILATNADAIEQALGAYIARLEHLRENLRSRQLQEEFTAAATLAQRLRSS